MSKTIAATKPNKPILVMEMYDMLEKCLLEFENSHLAYPIAKILERIDEEYSRDSKRK